MSDDTEAGRSLILSLRRSPANAGRGNDPFTNAVFGAEGPMPYWVGSSVSGGENERHTIILDAQVSTH